MSKSKDSAPEREPTPVDEIRAIRERLSREAQGDVRRLVAECERATEQYVTALGLTRVTKRDLESKSAAE
jgi:hypothetical protein